MSVITFTHLKDAYHEPKAHITMLCIISRLRRSHFIVCVCKLWHVRHILHANLFAIHDTECQFMLSMITIHAPKVQFITQSVNSCTEGAIHFTPLCNIPPCLCNKIPVLLHNDFIIFKNFTLIFQLCKNTCFFKNNILKWHCESENTYLMLVKL